MKAILTTLLAACWLTAGTAQARDPRSEEALEAASRTGPEIHMDGELGTPQFITGDFPYSGALSAEAVAIAFLSEHKAALGVPVSHDFQVIRSFPDGDNAVVRVSQFANGIPIFGSDVAINISPANEVRVVSGRFYAAEFDTVPSIGPDAAIVSARAALDEPLLTAPPSAELAGFVRHQFGSLAWNVELSTTSGEGMPTVWHCLIGAHDGRLLAAFSDVGHLIQRATYDLQNGTGAFLRSAPLIIPEGGTTNDRIAMTTHDNVGFVYDYYRDTHGRDGLDNAGGLIQSYVHWGVDSDFAAFGFVNGVPAMVFGDGNLGGPIASTFPVGTALDVVAHEYTHGVTRFSAGLGASEQSLTLNESMSDVFAMLVDADDWLLGEDLFKGEVRALESISNPPEFGAQPDHMRNYRLNTRLVGLDQHKNAGITNKAFFNIASTIGRPDAGRMYYRALTVYMTSSTNFVGARLALEQAAVDLFGPASPQLAAVQDGFAAVGIIPPPADFAGTFVADPRIPSVDAKGAVTLTFVHPGASAMKLVFAPYRFPGRPVYIKDGMGTVVYVYSGADVPAGVEFTTGPVRGDTLTLEYFPVQPGEGFVLGTGWPTVGGYLHGEPDLSSPVLSAVSIDNLDHFSATLTWRTDEPADAQVEFGESLAYGSTTRLQDFKTFEHRVQLNELMPGTTYHVLAKSIDFNGNPGNSGDLTFTTPAATDAVTISRLKWPLLSVTVRIQATSTDPTATLSVHGFAGRLIGVMDSDGKGGHKIRFEPYFNSGLRPESFRVQSSSGGFDSRTILGEVITTP